MYVFRCAVSSRRSKVMSGTFTIEKSMGNKQKKEKDKEKGGKKLTIQGSNLCLSIVWAWLDVLSILLCGKGSGDIYGSLLCQ